MKLPNEIELKGLTLCLSIIALYIIGTDVSTKIFWYKYIATTPLYIISLYIATSIMKDAKILQEMNKLCLENQKQQ
jgi:hypothetical protein